MKKYIPLLRSRIKFYKLGDYYDDAFSIGLEAIYNAIISFREGEFLFYTFVLSCLNNKLITFYKKTTEFDKKEKKVIFELSNTAFEDSKKKFVLSDNYIFYGLSSEENTLVKMRYYLNYSFKEITDLTGYTAYKTKKLLDNAVKKIKNNVIF